MVDVFIRPCIKSFLIVLFYTTTRMRTMSTPHMLSFQIKLSNNFCSSKIPPLQSNTVNARITLIPVFLTLLTRRKYYHYWFNILRESVKFLNSMLLTHVSQLTRLVNMRSSVWLFTFNK